MKLEVWDSPNSAGVITDAIRCLKLGLDRGLEVGVVDRRLQDQLLGLVVFRYLPFLVL